MKWRVLLVVCAALGCTPRQPWARHQRAARTISVPITVTEDRALLVDMIINGERLTLQLDTAANQTTITPAARARIGVPHGVRAWGHGAGGRLRNVELVRAHHARLGNHDIHDLPLAVAELAIAHGAQDGMLGQDVLARFIAELDLPRRRLVLHPRGTLAWHSDDLVSIPYTTIRGGLIQLDVTLGGRRLAAILDVGAHSTIANLAAVGGRVGLSAGTTVGTDGNLIPVTGVEDVVVELGELDLAAPSLLVGDLPVFRTLGGDRQPMMILGLDLLATKKLVIEPTRQQLYISRP